MSKKGEMSCIVQGNEFPPSVEQALWWSSVRQYAGLVFLAVSLFADPLSVAGGAMHAVGSWGFSYLLNRACQNWCACIGGVDGYFVKGGRWKAVLQVILLFNFVGIALDIAGIVTKAAMLVPPESVPTCIDPAEGGKWCDTCPFALDGECDIGGRGGYIDAVSAACSKATDCTDCRESGISYEDSQDCEISYDRKFYMPYHCYQTCEEYAFFSGLLLAFQFFLCFSVLLENGFIYAALTKSKHPGAPADNARSPPHRTAVGPVTESAPGESRFPLAREPNPAQQNDTEMVTQPSMRSDEQRAQGQAPQQGSIPVLLVQPGYGHLHVVHSYYQPRFQPPDESTPQSAFDIPSDGVLRAAMIKAFLSLFAFSLVFVGLGMLLQALLYNEATFEIQRQNYHASKYGYEYSYYYAPMSPHEIELPEDVCEVVENWYGPVEETCAEYLDYYSSGSYEEFSSSSEEDLNEMATNYMVSKDDDNFVFESYVVNATVWESFFARVRTTIRVRNAALAGESGLGVFLIELPDSAVVSGISLVSNGIVYIGEVRESLGAVETFGAALHNGSVLFQQLGRESPLYELSVAISPASTSLVMLDYEQLVVKRDGFYELSHKILPGRVFDEFRVYTTIHEESGFNTLVLNEAGYSGVTPILYNAQGVDKVVANWNFGSLRSFASGAKAVLRWKPKSIPDGRGKLIQSVVTGTFFHRLAVDPAAVPLARRLVFVLDMSGSLSWGVDCLLRNSVYGILDTLDPIRDYFSIVTFNEYTFRMSKSLILASADNVGKAKCWLRAAYSYGSSDFNTAMLWGLGVLKTFLVDDEQSAISAAPTLVFFTDGYASSGITNPSEIYYSFLRKNQHVGAVMHTVSIGWKADQKLLQALSETTGGINYILTSEKTFIEDVVEDFWGAVGYTALRNVSITYSGARLDHVSTASFVGMQAGGEVVVTGKLGNDSVAEGHTVVARVTAMDADQSPAPSPITASPSSSLIGAQDFMVAADAVVWVKQLYMASANIENCTLSMGCVDNSDGDINFYDPRKRAVALEAAIDKNIVISGLTAAVIVVRPLNVPLDPTLAPYAYNSSSTPQDGDVNNATRLTLTSEYDPSIGYADANGAAHRSVQLAIALGALAIVLLNDE